MLEQDVTEVWGIVGIVGAIGALFIKLWNVAAKYAQLELKVNTLWDFLMRRSIASGVDNGVVTMNSPIKSTRSMDELLEPFAKDFAELYKNIGCHLNERDLFIEFEKSFGDRIMREICIPYKIHQGAAIFAAIDVAKKRYKNCLLAS